MKKIGYELLNHLPYSTDLLPYDFFFLSPKIKSYFPGIHFDCMSELFTAVEETISNKDAKNFRSHRLSTAVNASSFVGNILNSTKISC